MPSLIHKLNPNLERELSYLQKKIDYTFKDEQLLINAVLHRSALGPLNQLEPNHNYRDNDRLEFLGDAVLDLAISDILMHAYPQYKVGELSKLRAALVNEGVLAEIAAAIDLEKALVLGPGERPAKPSILADAVEALIGAIYSEAGLSTTAAIISTLFSQHITKINGAVLYQDAKTDLQEWSQQKYGKTPSYQTLAAEGPDHARTFEVGVYLNDHLLGSAKGSSKKSAEQNAAFAALVARDEKRLRIDL